MSDVNYLAYDSFDKNIVPFDTSKYKFKEWVLNKVQQMGFPLDDLQSFHEVIPLERTAEVTRKLISCTQEESFRFMAYEYVREVFWPLVDFHPIAIQRFFNVRVLLPNRPEMLLPFHNGVLQGHGLGQRTNWMPLTDAFDTASMYITDIETSRGIIDKARENETPYSQLQEILRSSTSPANIAYGESVLFTQENLHGNVTNETGKSRMSIDFRILLKGGDYSFKIPGGYFIPMDK